MTIMNSLEYFRTIWACREQARSRIRRKSFLKADFFRSFGQADGTVLLRVAKRQQRSPQQRAVRKVGMVIGQRAECDHAAMLPQAMGRGQMRDRAGREEAVCGCVQLNLALRATRSQSCARVHSCVS